MWVSRMRNASRIYFPCVDSTNVNCEETHHMKTRPFRIEGLTAAALVALSAVSGVGYADDHGKRQGGFGTRVEHLLHSQSERWFGINKPLPASAAPTSGDYRTPQQAATEQVALAKGLHATYLTRAAGNHSDMMAFWPSDANATHLITCVEGGREVIGTNADGSFQCADPAATFAAYVGAHCSLFLGWHDSCDACTEAPTKWGQVGTGSCANGAGADDTCTEMNLGDATVQMFGLSTDGDVNDDDTLYIGLRCDQ